ncbi:MAG: hypothetical protein WCY85_07410 [Sulfurimonas sp.]
MKLNNLQELNSLKPIQRLRPLKQTPTSENIKHIRLSELLLYSSNLCLFSMRILRDEIQVPERAVTLNVVASEISKIRKLLSSNDMMIENYYTKKDTKNFFKKVGLKPKHIKTN